jgi:predicted phosphodiesterase
MLVAWASDIHLNFVDERRARRFADAVAGSGAEALLVGGDIADGPSLERWLRFLERRVPLAIHFVLGNHDFYHGDFAGIGRRVRALASDRLRYLPAEGVVRLSEAVGVVGHGGWGDARHGDFLGSPLVLSDFVLIDDLRRILRDESLGGPERRKRALREKLNSLGDEAAALLRPSLVAALDRYDRVIVLTHVPPFADACRYRGVPAGDDWVPNLTCKAVGDLLLEAAAENPTRDIVVLCGHTHGRAEARPLPNLCARARDAEYGRPDFELIDVADPRRGARG